MSEFIALKQQMSHALRVQEYDELFPFAFLASVIVNVNRGKGAKTVSAEDFIGKRPAKSEPIKSNPQSIDPNQRQKDMELANRLGVKVPK